MADMPVLLQARRQVACTSLSRMKRGGRACTKKLKYHD
jgi:hypothetical protein